MAVNLQINGTSLQTSTIITSTIGDDSSPSQQLSLQEITRVDGEKLVSTVYKPRNIMITGTIKGTSLANLETNIDTFKKTCSIVDGRLDIEYAGTVRRFVVSTESIAIERSHYHITFAPFSVSFIVYDPPFGKNVTALGGNLSYNEALSSTNNMNQALQSTVSFDGTAPPRPIITYTIDKADELGEIHERVIGKKNILSVGTAFTSGDVIIFDMDNQIVLWNGRTVNFEGTFPEYEIGDNTIHTLFNNRTNRLDQQQTNIEEFITVSQDTNHQFQGFQTSFSGTIGMIEVYMKRDLNVRSGTLTLDIRNASGNNPGPTTITNGTANIVNISDIPLDGGWIMFLYTLTPSVTLSTDYRFVIRPSGLVGGNIYIGISTGNDYANGMYGYSLNAGSVWRNDPNLDMTFRIWRIGNEVNPNNELWRVDKKVEYIKRYL